jgi:hypothetical protein
MRVVQVCTQDSGGAGIAAYRLNTGLRKIGIDSKLIVVTKTKEDSAVYAIPDNFSEERKLINETVYSSKNNIQIWNYWFNEWNIVFL